MVKAHGWGHEQNVGPNAFHFGIALTLGPYLVGNVPLNRHKVLGELERSGYSWPHGMHVYYSLVVHNLFNFMIPLVLLALLGTPQVWIWAFSFMKCEASQSPSGMAPLWGITIIITPPYMWKFSVFTKNIILGSIKHTLNWHGLPSISMPFGWSLWPHSIWSQKQFLKNFKFFASYIKFKTIKHSFLKNKKWIMDFPPIPLKLTSYHTHLTS
jgi:hypothetical protein